MGIGRTVARSGTPRPQAALRNAASARAFLFRSVYRLHRTDYRLRRRRHRAVDGELRLAHVDDECVESRTRATRSSSSHDCLVESACRTAADVVPRISPATFRTQAGGISGTRTMGAAAE